MKLGYTRREVLRQGIIALPAFHVGLGTPGILSAWTTAEEQANRFQKLQLATHADQLEGMRKFYRDVLNLPLVSETADAVTFQAGHTQLRFYADARGGSPFYHFAFNIPENKLEKSMDWLTGRAELLKGRAGNQVVYFNWLDAHSVYFYDPAGNILEFIAHHPLKNGRSGSFHVEDILYVSEIGLVTDDVPNLSTELGKKLGLSNYAAEHRQSVSDVFRPIGDPTGFFIVVKHKRRWLMTDDLAGLFPVTAAITGRPHRSIKLDNCACELLVTE